MKMIELQIPDMRSVHCQSRVKNAVEAIDGVTVQTLEAGKLAASIYEDALEIQMLQAIEKAGYTIAFH